jgi:hemoglobin/transferrin/lactoferrin receptor protein
METLKSILTAIILYCLAGNGVFAQGSGITGKVVLESSGTGMAYVHVQLSMEGLSGGPLYSSITDEGGNFGFRKLEPGEYRIRISHMGYHNVETTTNLGLDDHKTLEFKLTPALIPLGEVSVSSLRYNRKEREVSLPVSVVPRENIPRQSAITLSDVLGREPGMAVYRDGIWGTSVSVRGLGSDRMVSLIDGNRIETATDLAAGLSMIDINEIERVEVIKGAASSIYGTGAMGGVINIITRKGDYMDEFGIRGDATGFYENANKLFGGHVGLDAGDQKWKVRLSGGYRTADDIKTPEGILENSSFSDQNMNAYFGFKPFKNHELLLNYQDYTAKDAGIPGGAPFGKSAVAKYLMAKRRLISGKYAILGLSPVITEVSLRYYNQFILRDVEMIPNAGPVLNGNNRMTLNRVLPTGEHNTQGIVLETMLKLGENNKLAAGIDLWQRELITSREKYITQEILDDFDMIINTLDIMRGEKPIPDSRFGSAGLFLQDEISLLDNKLDLTIGGRIDVIHVKNEQALDPVSLIVNGEGRDLVPGQRVIYDEQETSDFSWSANASGMYHLTGDLDLVSTIGRSYRSPSLEERFKYIDLGSKVRLGDPDLKPEKGLFYDLGLRYWKSGFNFNASLFANYLNNMIVETPGEFVYRLTAEEGAGITDTLPALVNANVDRALLYGFEASFNAALFQDFVINGQAAYVRGRNLTTDGNLPLIPPLSTALGARYHILGSFVAEWTTRYFAKQDKVVAGEAVTEGYFVSDLSLYSMPAQFGIASFQLFAGVDNIFNKSYVNHLATNRGMVLVEPGRNVFLKIKMGF